MEEFHNRVHTIYRTIVSNVQESETLAQKRASLLPALVSASAQPLISPKLTGGESD